VSRNPADRSIAPLPRSASWGLLAAWAVHDAEELWTMAGWADRARPRLERTLPGVPARSWDGLSVSRPHAAVAIGLVGAFVGVAAARGRRNERYLAARCRSGPGAFVVLVRGRHRAGRRPRRTP
jgi:hypothetical protein